MSSGADRRRITLAPLLAWTVACASSGPSPALPADPHLHPVAVHDVPWVTDLAPQASVAPVEETQPGSDSVLSSDGDWHAFVVHPSDEPGGRVRFESLLGRRSYELRGLPLPQRPLSGLVWLDADRLAFDRWSQPHHGVHYVLDVRRRRLVLAAPFPDTVGRPGSRRGTDRADEVIVWASVSRVPMSRDPK